MKLESDLWGSVSRLQSDTVLTAIAGCLSLSTAFHCHRNIHASKFRMFMVPHNGYDVIGLSTIFMAMVGAANIFIAAGRFNGYCKFNFNKYIFCLVTTLICNFALGVLITDLRSKLTDSLADVMRPKLQESVMSQLSLGVGFAQSEAWDYLHVNMHCCGVESYQDYLMKQKTATQQPLPMSCCVMKPVHKTEGQSVPENAAQCMLDAAHKVTESIFLHIQGCRGPLSRWLLRHMSKMTAMIFASMCVQAMTLLYLSWKGFQKSTVSYR